MKLQQTTLTALAMTVSSALGAAEKPEAPKLKPKVAICEAPVCEVRVKPVIMTSAQIFANADKDKDGKLSAKEFEAAYKLIVIQEKFKATQAKPVKPAIPVVPAQPMGPGDGCPGCGLG